MHIMFVSSLDNIIIVSPTTEGQDLPPKTSAISMTLNFIWL